MTRKSKIELTVHQCRQVAVKACVDPRTVQAYLDGKPCHSTTSERVRLALAELGLVS